MMLKCATNTQYSFQLVIIIVIIIYLLLRINLLFESLALISRIQWF